MKKGGDLEILPVTEELLSKALKGAHDDGHGILYATHCVVREGEVIGAFSVFSPTIYWWMHTERSGSRDSLMVHQAMKGLVENQGSAVHYMPIQKSSPYLPYMRSMGYESMGEWEIFKKSEILKEK